MVTTFNKKTGKFSTSSSGSSGTSGSQTTKSSNSAPAGSLTFTSGGQQWIATPNKDVTQEQIKKAKASGWTPYSGEMPTGGNVVKGGMPLPSVDTTIRADVIANQKPVPQIPPAPVIKSPEPTLVAVPETTVQDTTQNQNIDAVVSKRMSSIFGNAPEMPSAVKLQQDIEKNLQVRQKEQQVQNYANQINAINSQAQANILSLTGQGRGIPEVIIGGQQEQVKREAAIQTLPLQVLLSAAQGDLDSTRAYASTLFDMYYKDATAKYDQWWRAAEVYRDEYSKVEQRQLDALKAQKDRENELVDRKLRFNESLAVEAAKNGQYGLAQQIMNTKPPEVGDTQGWADYDRQISRLTSSISVPSTVTDTGTISPYMQERNVRIIQSIDDLYGRVNPQTVGLASIGRFVPGSIPRNFKADLDVLKSNIAFGALTEMREASKTGGALGQVSNIELGLLESAMAALDQGQSPANFKKNLDRIKASVQRFYDAKQAVGNITVAPNGEEIILID